MAYEKYITRNGKVYGPYVYHSKRVDGKVVSEYRGPNSKPKVFKKSVKKKIVKPYERKKETFPAKRQAPEKIKIPKLREFVVGGMFVFLLVVLGLFFFSSQLTGKSIVDFEGEVVSDNVIGTIYLTLNGGELIPADSKLVIVNENNTYEFLLSDIFNEETIVGKFFLQGTSLSGIGEGFGLLGKEELPVDISFSLQIDSQNVSGSGGSSEVVEPINNHSSGADKNLTNEVSENVSSSTDEVVEPIAEETSVPVEEVTEPVANNVSEPAVEEKISEPVAEVVDNKSESAPITGNVVSNLFGGIAQVFNSIITGRSIDALGEVQGEVSIDKEFTYDIPAGVTVSLIPGSVNSNGVSLNDDVLEFEIVDNVLTVKTNYSNSSVGFGEEYLTDEKKEFSINLANHGIDLVEGNLNVAINYNSSEVTSFSTNVLKSELNETVKNKTVSEVAEEIFNSTNVTVESNFVNLTLTEEEKVILRSEFKMIVVNTTASDYRDKVLVEFKLGDYVMSNSYDKSLSDSKLRELIEKDRIIWLKDLARELSYEKSTTTSRDEFNSLFPVM